MLIAILTVSCSNKNIDGDTVATDDSLKLPDSEVRIARIQLYKKGEVTAEILSDKIIKFDAQDSTMAYKLDINIFDSLGQATTEITGDSGVIREGRGIVNIYGNVVVIINDTTRLDTDYLWWNSNNNRIKSDAFVRITRGSDVITGWGLDADNKLNSFRILNQVSGEISDKEAL
jgi:LPS export ABC transporter protein LptC